MCNEPTGLSRVVCVMNLLDYLGSECNEPTGLSRYMSIINLLDYMGQ